MAIRDEFLSPSQQHCTLPPGECAHAVLFMDEKGEKPMNPAIQDTLLQLFEHVRQDPDTLPAVPVDDWQEGSIEWRLLSGFQDVLEQLQQRTLQSTQMEQQLRDQESLYHSAFAASNNGLLIADNEDGRIIEVNPAACTMYGYTYEEMIGLQGTDLFDPDSHPQVEKITSKLSLGGFVHAQLVARRKDGTTFHTDRQATTFTYKGKLHRLAIVRDVTERVQAEEQLHEKEEQYRSVFEATDDGLNILDLDGFIVEVNPAFCNMFGYPYEEIIGLHTSVLTVPEYLPVVTEALETIISGDQYHAKGLGLRKDGTVFHVEAHSTPFNYKGKPHLLGVTHDITERVQAEEQLREKEEQYRSIFEASTDGLIIRNMDGFVVEANPAACSMHGYAYEEFLGLHRTNIVHPEHHALVAEYMKAIQAGHTFQGQAVDLRKDGTAFPVEVRGSTFMYLGKPHTLSLLRDITERVQAEEQLREKEEQYRSIFEATYDALFIIDLDGYIVEVNPAYCSMFGYTREEVIGMHASSLTLLDYLPGLDEALETVKTGETFQAPAIVRCPRKDGTVFYAEAQSTTFTYRGKSHALGVVRDITERVEAEQHLREKEAQYRGVFEAASDAMVITNLDGFVIEANPAACTMYGYTYEELLGLHRTILTHREYHYLVPESIQTIKAGGHYQARTVDQRKDGTPFPVDGRGTPFIFKGQPTVLAVIRDITEQVQAEQLLEQRVEDRTRELSSLLEISHTVASTLQLKPLLGLILDQLKTVVDYTGSAILTVEGEDLVFLDNRGPVPEAQLMQLRFPLKNLGLIWETITSRESIIMQDIRNNTPLERAFRVAIGDLRKTTFHHIRACMIIPLTLKEQAIGMLVLLSSEKQAFMPHHATLALAIANQAAIAIENARLYEQAQQLAALEERQRLARELHDSVSQALYGIALGAHTARTLLDRDPAQVAEPLDYVLSLAEAGLAEMRALIFELRPESLEIEGLVSALTKQGAALHARHDITVQTDLSAEPALPLKVKQELYRIAQEALHNTVKHAHASEVELRLCQTSEAVILEVC